jgi:beta-lactam-binding protein with PASTA domain
METNWIILIIVLVCSIILIIYLIKRNMKDQEDVVKFMNETEIEDDPKLKEHDDISQKLN